MKYPAQITSRALILGSSLLCSGAIFAQEQTAKPAEPTATQDEDVVYLSPFEVTSEGSIGYQARDTLAGTRLRTDLKDVANAVQVINSQFLQDTGATDTKSLLVYTTNTEVGGTSGNFANVGDGTQQNDTSNRVSPQTNTRVRGLTSADNTRNFFLTRTPWDSYNVDRVDIQRGANSILFGIGSPAGIINSNIQQASFYNEGKVEEKFGSYGSIRGSVNVNRVILDDELAIRVAGLYNDEEYRQRPAYQDDQRIYLAARYDPKWLRIGSSKFSLKMNYEHGKIDANRPRVTPPIDRITPWYTDMGQKTYDNRYTNSTAASDKSSDTTGYSWHALSSGDANYEPWLSYWGSDYYGPVAIFEDANSSTQAMIVTGQSTEIDGSTTPPSPNLLTIFGNGVALTSTWASNVSAPGSSIGAWHDVQLSDTSVFDFYNNLLDGDTKKEEEKWDALNMTATETFFDNAMGVELAYDYQKDKQSYKAAINASGYAIGIDIARYLPDGTLNPNVGRAYVASRSYGYSDDQMRNTVRATAFIDIDLKKYLDPDSWLVRILGRHEFQGNFTHMGVNTVHREWEGAYGENYDSLIDITQGAREVATLSYLSGSLLGTSLGDNLGLSRIKASRNAKSGTVSLYDPTTGTYVDQGIKILDDANSDDMSKLYRATSCYDEKKVTDSFGAVWNGYLLDNTIVPTVGYRHDKQVDYNSGKANVNAEHNIANFDDPSWYVPTSKSDADADGANGRTYASESGSSTSWGVVAHMPEYLIKKMPLGLNLSLFYDKSDNFEPDASRVDLEGNTLSSPKGKTRDYGFMISALDDRISLKVNWYKTTETNASLSTALSGSEYYLGMGEGWALQQMVKSIYGRGAGTYSTDYNILEDGTQVDLNGDGAIDSNDFLPWQPNTEKNADSIKAIYADYEACKTAMLGADGLTYQGKMSEGMQRAWFGQTVSEFIAKVKAAAAASPSAANDAGGSMSMSVPSGMAVTGDEESKGIEFELTTQITKNWNVSLNAAKTTATRFNLASIYADYSEATNELYKTAYGNARLWGPGYTTAETLGGRWGSTYYGNYMLQRALEGSNVPELCKWHFNVITNYTFDEGALKGINVGGGYRWQDKSTIGYPIIKASDDSYSYDIDHPWKGPIEQYLDIWVGYERQINDKLNWRIQLNVKNLFNKDDLIPTTVNPADKDGDGVYESYTYATYRIPEGRTWYITNTLTF
jgi:outer membrane receptor protein involved in Fe transport